MSLKKTDVEGYKIDDKTKVVINTNTSEYNQYMERRRRTQQDKMITERINKIEQKILHLEELVQELSKKVT